MLQKICNHRIKNRLGSKVRLDSGEEKKVGRTEKVALKHTLYHV